MQYRYTIAKRAASNDPRSVSNSHWARPFLTYMPPNTMLCKAETGARHMLPATKPTMPDLVDSMRWPKENLLSSSSVDKYNCENPATLEGVVGGEKHRTAGNTTSEAAMRK